MPARDAHWPAGERAAIAKALRQLVPAVRAGPLDTILAATGVSCRQQIALGPGRTAGHPLEIVRQAVG